MATPVNDSYSVESGVAIYAGRFGGGLPAWLPASGSKLNVSLNTISSQYMLDAPDTRTRGSTAILTAWCGTVYAPTLGEYGSIIAWGGGHADYLGNEVYRYDIDTRMWSRILDPYDIPVSYSLGTQADDPADGNGTGTGVSSTVNGEYWSDDTKSSTVVGQPCATHTYGHILWVSGTAAGNTNGWLVMVGNFNFQCHKVDLDNPSAGWSRFGVALNSTGKNEPPAYGCSIFDPSRNRVWCFPYANGQQTFGYALAVPAGTLTTPSQDYLEAYYTVGHYDETDDLYLLMRANDPSVFKIHDPITSAKYSPTVTGVTPVAGAGTVGWIESTRTLYYWPGTGSTVYFLQAPSNPRTQSWVWTSQTFSGDSPATGGANPMYGRLHYVQALNSLIHVGTTTGPVQCWRL